MVQAKHEGCIRAQKGLLPVGSIWFEHVGQPLDLRVRYGGSVQTQNRGYATQAILPIQGAAPNRIGRIPRRSSDRRCSTDAYQCGEGRIFRVLLGRLMTGVNPSMGKK